MAAFFAFLCIFIQKKCIKILFKNPSQCASRVHIGRGETPARETPRARQPARQRQPDRAQQTAHAPALKRGTHRRPRKTHCRAIGRWSAGQRETAESRSRAAETMRWRPFSHGLNTACNKMGRYEAGHVLKLNRDFPRIGRIRLSVCGFGCLSLSTDFGIPAKWILWAVLNASGILRALAKAGAFPIPWA